MARSLVSFLLTLLLTLAFVLSCLPVRAQMYPQDIHSQKRWTGSTAPSPSSLGGMGMGVDSASAFFQRRQEEERERRELWERQRRMMENYTNIPDQLRESYYGRADRLPFNSR
jgi:hypothetical protein